MKSGDGGVEGRLEVCFNNLWGTASMIQSSSSVAGVICKHLGYEASGENVYRIRKMNLLILIIMCRGSIPIPS